MNEPSLIFTVSRMSVINSFGAEYFFYFAPTAEYLVQKSMETAVSVKSTKVDALH